jgi:uncharacterized protein
MLRVPGAEPVKTRLHGALGRGPATLLYRCILLDTLEAAAAVPDIELVAAYSPARAAPSLAALVRRGTFCLPQRGEDLGARMANLVTDLLAGGRPGVLVTGSDLPTLPSAHLVEAARALTAGAADVVLGPAEDGGYYLIGLARPAPRLFAEVAWGAADVLELTRARARALGLRVHLLPPWYDVDTPADLARLRHDLMGAGPSTERGAGAWRTRRWLAAYGPPHPALSP